MRARRRAWMIIGMAALAGAVGAAEQSNVLAGADARIERHRKGDAIVTVVGRDGKPVPGAQIGILQTRHAFLFGCNIFMWSQPRAPELEAAYRRRYADLLNYATLPFYWWAYETDPGQPQHANREALARWCRDQGIATKGHPLAWNFRDPRWLPDDGKEVRRLQLERIGDCVRQFDGLIERWDVVNEVTDYGRADCWSNAPRLTRMYQEEGPIAVTRACFEEARRANPEAVLLINDYATDPSYERVIEQLVDGNGRRLYDAIGIQSHMHGGAWSSARAWEVCERFARFGVPLHFTEVTILSGEQGWQDRSPWPSTPEGEERQARDVVDFYTALFSHPSVEAITWWDFSDRGAWKKAPAGLLRADMSPKPAYDELLKLVKERWWTRRDGIADAEGRLAFRGFLGDYQVTAKVAGDTRTASFTLERSRDNEWVVKLGER